MADEPRRYSDEEFALVLRKAMELQESGGGRSRAPPGLTLDEMRAVARDVGIDPSLVDRAVALIGRPPASRAERLTGGPTSYRLEETVRGAVSEEAYSRIVDAIRRVSDHPGEVRSELGSLVWLTVGEISQIHVAVAPRNGRTEVRVSADRGNAFVLTWFVSVAVAMMVAGVLSVVFEPATLAGGAALFGGMATAGLATARSLWNRGTERFRKHLDALMEAVRREAEAGASEAETGN